MNLEILRKKIRDIRESLDDLEDDIELALDGARPEPKEVETANLDFEEIYELYPRKRGKTLGIKRCKSQVKTLRAWADLRIAVENYGKATAEKEAQYIMHFSTFMNCWKEWISPEEEAGPSPLTPRAKQNSDHYRDQASRIAAGEL